MKTSTETSSVTGRASNLFSSRGRACETDKDIVPVEFRCSVEGYWSCWDVGGRCSGNWREICRALSMYCSRGRWGLCISTSPTSSWRGPERQRTKHGRSGTDDTGCNPDPRTTPPS